MIAARRLAELVAVSVRAPADARLDADAIWKPRDSGWEMQCAGIAAEIRGEGPGRFGAIAAAARDVFARVRVLGLGEGAPAPRMIGGFAFAPGAGWAGFPDARFVLPRVTYWRRGDEAWLTAIDEAPDQTMLRYEPRPLGRVRAVREADPDLWRRHIAEIRAAIARGDCDKIVAARTCEVELDAPIDATALLERLPAEGTTRFAMRSGGRVFVGATPERLIGLAGREVATEALAGSIARDRDPALLLASEKDRHEHALVVDAIRRALAPLCSQLDIPAAPSVRTLRNIHHLHTPVRGVLAAPRHLVEIAGALHPTPAVGGTPREAALAWIAAREPAPRGWYAAPVGWFDADGDGELAIAIRSALVDRERATLFAGAGIVRDSDAEAELDETRVKLGAILGSLGCEKTSQPPSVPASQPPRAP